MENIWFITLLEKKTENVCVVAPFNLFSLYKLGLQAIGPKKKTKVTVSICCIEQKSIHANGWLAADA